MAKEVRSSFGSNGMKKTVTRGPGRNGIGPNGSFVSSGSEIMMPTASGGAHAGQSAHSVHNENAPAGASAGAARRRACGASKRNEFDTSYNNGMMSPTDRDRDRDDASNESTSSIQSNSNSEEYSDTGEVVEPHRGLVVTPQQRHQRHRQLIEHGVGNSQSSLIISPQVKRPSSTAENRFKIVSRVGLVEENSLEDPYGPMSGNFYPATRGSSGRLAGDSAHTGGSKTVTMMRQDTSQSQTQQSQKTFCAYHPTSSTTVGPTTFSSSVDLRRGAPPPSYNQAIVISSDKSRSGILN